MSDKAIGDAGRVEHIAKFMDGRTSSDASAARNEKTPHTRRFFMMLLTLRPCF
jgi:hypothetical protein